jgi:hypothetical protein
MAVQTVENIQRLPPFLEGLQKRMLQTGFGEFDDDGNQTTKGLLDSALGLPQFQIAGIDPLRKKAISLGEQLAGSYQPFIKGARDQSLAGQQALTAGLGTLGGAGRMITGAEGVTRGGLTDLGLGRSAIGAGMRDFNAGRGAVAAGQGFLQQASDLTDPSKGISKFMNPFQQQVIDSTMRQLDEQADKARQGDAARAIQSGAFGGGREGIQRAERDKGLQQAKADTLSRLLSANYAQALQGSQNAAKLQAGLGQASGDLGARFGSLGQGRGDLGARFGQLGQTRGQLGTSLGQLGGALSTVAGRQGAIGQQFGTLAGTTSDIGRLQQALGQADVSQLSQLGAMRQAQQQAGLDAYRQNQMQKVQDPYTRLQIGQNLLQGMPSSSIPSTFAQTATPSANPFLQGIGAYTTLSQIAPFGGGASSSGRT